MFRKDSTAMCIVFVLVGAVLGGILGEVLKHVDALAGVMPYLVHSYPVFDMQPTTMDFYVVRLTLGIAFMPNLMSVLGMAIALILFKKY